MQDTQVLLRPEVGELFSLPVEQFHRLVALGHNSAGELATPSPLSEVARSALQELLPKSLEAANKRWREILAYFRGDAITVTPRSVQNWMAAYRQAEADMGCGYIGLLDRVALRGNRSPRVPDASKELLKEYLLHALHCTVKRNGRRPSTACTGRKPSGKESLLSASAPFIENWKRLRITR